MNETLDWQLRGAAEQIRARIRGLLSTREGPIVIALDGGSGAGKSTIASRFANQFDAALIPLDDFFAANIPDRMWDTFTAEEKLQRVFDWERLRQDAIQPLLRGQPAQWHAFDFTAGLRADGTYGMEKDPKIVQPSRLVLIEGAYSASPALDAFLDFTVFIDVPVEERHRRLKAREDQEFLEIWHRRWDEVEDYYFTHVRPRSSFDFVLEFQ